MDKEELPIGHYLFVLGVGFTVAMIVYFMLWENYIYSVHTLIETVCVFIGASTFLIVWNTLDKVPRINDIIGYGFLFVAVFDACHTYIYVAQLASSDNLLNFSMKSWALGRLAQAVMLYLATLKFDTKKINKWLLLILTLAFSFGINLAAYYFPEVFPTMSTASGLTTPKIVTEIIVIFFTIPTMINLRKNSGDEARVFKKHLVMSLLLIIPTEVMFTIYVSEYSFAFVYAHILKMLYYYFIYKSVFVSSIEYPYEKLRLENIKLEDAYKLLGENKQEETRRQSILMQQEKLALLGQMGAGIVHETRNYLTTIKGSCQLAEVLTNEEGLLRHIRKINKSVDEIDKIIGKFLVMSKPREMELLEISMYDLSQSVQSLIMSTSLIKQVDVQFELSEEERYLLCDESQINQVVLNLCKNAVEAMEGMCGPRLYIKTDYDQAANEMSIEVRDNGKGISSADLAKVGTPFFTTKTSGTGLGLYMCNQIIKDHKGKIDASSELGRGTIFTIKLPCLPADEEEEEEKITNDVSEFRYSV